MSNKPSTLPPPNHPTTKRSNEISIQIQNILDTNEIKGLKEFIQKQKCLNQCNVVLSYFFHIIQSAGILVTTIATGYNQTEIIWLGVGLNILASLLNVFEKTNNSMMNKLTIDIQAIKDGVFITETPLIDDDEEKENAQHRL
jgi:hypothetical protein